MFNAVSIPFGGRQGREGKCAVFFEWKVFKARKSVKHSTRIVLEVGYPCILFSVNNKSGSIHFLFYFSWKVNNTVSSSTDANYLENKKAKTNINTGKKFKNYVTAMRRKMSADFTSVGRFLRLRVYFLYFYLTRY